MAISKGVITIEAAKKIFTVNDDTNINYGELLRISRKQLDFSQEQMAERLYISRSTVSKLEAGKRTLYMDILVRWFKIINRDDVLLALLSGMEFNRIKRMLTEENGSSQKEKEFAKLISNNGCKKRHKMKVI
ncbi:hypothetical protein BKP35_09010 [Anaerobacillus arseniciselenatis]|uniref:HTH cro/C1-type domain-containing protein n=1 Tax=Anaerobacillus arseniciselenatis TaxID=85682 RepID=A0A1S2LLZ9_9BACI|nr:helix-turn-helix transcriptional regulator [Anaerobacillus arseniciselenatis]OIJ13364.1 hypothetical protein BKP35_09010 [Anaerobacillus arseniciselenatis]